MKITLVQLKFEALSSNDHFMRKLAGMFLTTEQNVGYLIVQQLHVSKLVLIGFRGRFVEPDTQLSMCVFFDSSFV